MTSYFALIGAQEVLISDCLFWFKLVQSSQSSFCMQRIMLSYFEWGGVGGPCDFSASPSPFGLDFGTLDSDFGLGLVM